MKKATQTQMTYQVDLDNSRGELKIDLWKNGEKVRSFTPDDFDSKTRSEFRSDVTKRISQLTNNEITNLDFLTF